MRDVETQKRKNSQPRQIGCLKWFLIPVFIVAACYGGMWLFARYGGEWVAQQDIPLPPESQQVKTSEHKADYGYTCRRGVYIRKGSTQDLLDWFTDHEIGVIPPQIGSTPNPYNKESDYYSNAWDSYDWPWIALLHRSSVYITASWGDEYSPPHDVKIYESKEAFLKRYPDIDLPDGMSTFEVSLCWPDIK